MVEYTCEVCGRVAKTKITITRCKHKNMAPQQKETPIKQPTIPVQELPQNLVYQTLNNTKTIKYIVHLADIHIRLSKRHNQYRVVFDRLYSNLKQLDPDTLIVICGDILHDKISLSPESIVLFVEFVTNLSSIFPTLLISGNHDGLERNFERVDSIGAILKDRPIPNLFYLRDSGVYDYGNISFGVSSLFTPTGSNLKTPEFCPATAITTTNIKVALYHNSVGTPQNSQGFKLSGEVPVKKFDGYDYVMLGDIHKYQYLNPQKTIAYSSSLISQNFGECDDDHGYLLWDLLGKTSKYVQIPNEYAYKTYKIGKNLEIPTNIPQKGQIKLFFSKNVSIEDELKMLAYLKSTYPEANFVVDSKSIVKKNVGSKKLEINVDQEPNKLIRDYLKLKNPTILESDIEEIIQILDINNQAQNLGHNATMSKFELLNLKFSYLLGYGEGNEIDFEGLPSNEIIGIFGENSSGKSSLIDIVTIMLYGRLTRELHNRKHGDKQPCIIHHQQKKAHGELLMRIGVDLYLVSKYYTRTKSGDIKLVEGFYNLELDPEGDYSYGGNIYKKVSNTGKDRFDTTKEIVRLIGDFRDYLFNCISLQFNNSSFREMDSSERKSFLYRIFQLDIFTDKEKEVKSTKKKYDTLLEHNKQELAKIDRDRLLERQEQLNTLQQNQLKTQEKLESNIKNMNQQRDMKHMNLSKVDMDKNAAELSLFTLENNVENMQAKIDYNSGDLSRAMLEILDDCDLEVLFSNIFEKIKMDSIFKNSSQLFEKNTQTMEEINLESVFEKSYQLLLKKVELLEKQDSDQSFQENPKLLEKKVDLDRDFRNSFQLLAENSKLLEKSSDQSFIKKSELLEKLKNIFTIYFQYNLENYDVLDFFFESLPNIKSGIEKELVSLYNKKMPIHNVKSVEDLDSTILYLKGLETSIESDSILLEEMRPMVDEKTKNYERKIMDLERSIKGLDIDQSLSEIQNSLSKKRSELSNLEIYDEQVFLDYTRNCEIGKSLQSFRKMGKELEEYISKLNVHEYNPECAQCMSHPSKIELTNKELELSEISKKIVDLEKETYEGIEEKYSKMSEDKLRYDDLILEIDELDILEDELKNVDMLDVLRLEFGSDDDIGQFLELQKTIQTNQDILRKKDLPNLLFIKKCIDENEVSKIYNAEIDLEIDVLTQKSKKIAEILAKIFNTISSKNNINKYLIEISNLKNTLSIIENNTKLYVELDILNNQVQEVNLDLSLVVQSIERCSLELAEIQFTLKRYDELILELQVNEKKCRIYKYMLLLVEREGISLYLIDEYLECISANVNNVISGFVDSRVDLKIQEGKNSKKDIVLSIYPTNHNNMSVDIVGGMQGFMIDLAFKIVLSSLAKLPKSNMLVIDEGLSAFDSKSISNVSTLFDFLVQYYEKVLIISHIDQVQTAIDTRINVVKKEGYGSISGVTNI